MASIINASSTGSGGIVQTADASGVLQLQSNGTVAVNIASGGAVGIGGITNPTFPLVVQTSGTSTAVAGNVIARLQSTNTGYDATLQFSDNITNSGFMSMNSGNMIIGSYGTESIRFKSGGTVILQNGSTSATGIGITFPATQSASSDANTLDDYEEGTWTPTITGASSVTVNDAKGKYVRIGKFVWFQGRVEWVSLVGTTNVFGGLPFTCEDSSGEGGYSMAVTPYVNDGFGSLPSGKGYINGYVQKGNTTITFTWQPNTLQANFISTGNIYFTGAYIAV